MIYTRGRAPGRSVAIRKFKDRSRGDDGGRGERARITSRNSTYRAWPEWPALGWNGSTDRSLFGVSSTPRDPDPTGGIPPAAVHSLGRPGAPGDRQALSASFSEVKPTDGARGGRRGWGLPFSRHTWGRACGSPAGSARHGQSGGRKPKPIRNYKANRIREPWRPNLSALYRKRLRRKKRSQMKAGFGVRRAAVSGARSDAAWRAPAGAGSRRMSPSFTSGGRRPSRFGGGVGERACETGGHPVEAHGRFLPRTALDFKG